MTNNPNKKNLDGYVTLIAVVVLVLLNVVLLAGKMPTYYTGILRFMGINIILAVSLNLINGITGQFSLGHAGFMAVGAYVSALVSIHLGWPLVLHSLQVQLPHRSLAFSSACRR